MEKSFRRDFESLKDIFDFIDLFFAEEKIDGSHLYVVRLAAEELFTNMVKYNAGGGKQILIHVGRDDDRLELSLTDFDVDAFDVTRAETVSADLPLEQRRRGGLGLHIVKQAVDAMTYEYADRKSTVTVFKSLR